MRGVREARGRGILEARRRGILEAREDQRFEGSTTIRLRIFMQINVYRSSSKEVESKQKF